MKSLDLKVLANISSETEVFDRLLKVRREDTGEEGLLLCSHCCRWPSNLMNQATWLEGCNTPNHMANNHKLLMGYHPTEVTLWEFNPDTMTLTLKVNDVPSEESTGVRVEGSFPVPTLVNSRVIRHEEDEILENFKLRRFFKKVWTQSFEFRGLNEAVSVYFRTIKHVKKLNNWQKRHATLCLNSFLDEEGITLMHLIYEEDTDALERGYCEVYYNGLAVVQNNEEEGFGVAVALDNQKIYEFVENFVPSSLSSILKLNKDRSSFYSSNGKLYYVDTIEKDESIVALQVFPPYTFDEKYLFYYYQKEQSWRWRLVEGPGIPELGIA